MEERSEVSTGITEAGEPLNVVVSLKQATMRWAGTVMLPCTSKFLVVCFTNLLFPVGNRYMWGL